MDKQDNMFCSSSRLS